MILILDTLLMKPSTWAIPWILQSIAYYFVLRKMGLRSMTALVPFLAEREMSTVLFRKMRTFYRPFVIALVFLAGAYYLGPDSGVGYIYMLIAYFVYGLFLLRLYFQLSKSFGKGIIYTILLFLVPTIFLLVLGLGKSQYHPLEFRQEKNYGWFLNNLRRVTVAIISVAEILVLVAVVGLITIQTYPPRIIVDEILKSTVEKSKGIESDGKALSREDTMGEAAADIDKLPASRDFFFPDHSKDEKVVVMEYVIGADLEDRVGMATVNIDMMKEATKKGDALTFVLEAGGSKRWFTSGIKENGYGRYTVSGGKVETVEESDDMTSMEDPARLEKFIKWTAEKYPADRYMLVLWDHGGGLAFGYGSDQLSHRTDVEKVEGLRVSDITSVLKRSGVKFDLIGFDACLMQDVEIAAALEPYADYYLASEETEDGYGWYYTSAFGALAADPGMSTEEFGKNIISSYDQFNTVMNNGTPKPANTLSLVDLTRVKPAYEKLEEIYAMADEAMRKEQDDFAEIALAAMNTYSFVNDIQIDAVDFLEKLGDTDHDDSVCSQEERTDAANALKACVVYRNRNSAKGINGLSTALPYKQISCYAQTEAELNTLGFDTQKKFFNDIFSVIAVQKKAEHDSQKPEKYHTIGEVVRELTYVDYTKEDWYVKGFEDYRPSSTLVDIPLTDTGNGFSVQLPEKTWNIIADCVTAVYQKTDDGKLRYLGSDHLGDNDENGHPMVDMDDRWVHINDRLVCYEDRGALETENGTVTIGDVKARLNGSEDIVIHVEWDADENGEGSETGKVTGYDLVSDMEIMGPMAKGTQEFKSGDRIDFMFEYYNESGELVSTESYGRTVIVNTMDRLSVTDSPLEECDIEFLGMLTDAYQREYLTEVVDAHIGDK